FGVTHTALNRLQQRKCEIVDTTCGSVLTVWKRVEYYAQNGFTTIIHGKYPHEETIAVCSQISKYPAAKYLVIKNATEGMSIADFIGGNISKKEILRQFTGRYTTGFNPENDLQKIGFANQTTMLGGESRQIAEIVREAFAARYGEEQTERHFRSFDTVCSATQDRQDAVRDLLAAGDLDMMMIIGGFNSSNTAQLMQIASESVSSFHIQDPGDLISKQEIRHQTFPAMKVRITDNWLPDGAVKIGITAGASTPTRKIGQVLYRLFELKNIPAHQIKRIVNAT
ncbi:MAG TPA: 4-hydroxy-3-methylbut-2-enyl diphosphate reductase, partial [Bacteroidetes bacterium]|nr:4-hydroxy-3-methylbut-2-enyl diphosphate reductase [Bacteroidota bacterium]